MTKTNRNIYSTFSTLLIAMSVLLVASCTKDNAGPASSGVDRDSQQAIPVSDKETRKELKSLSDKVSTIAWYNTAMDKIISFNPQSRSKSFSFSDPNPGWNFSDDSETQWVPAENGGGILFVGAGSFGANSGSGTVVAGNVSLSVSTTFCFSASEEALGLDLVDLGGESPDFDGISGVIGIAGDFEALQNDEIDEEANIFDYFQGMAFYIVYDNEASGNYDILNWFEETDEDPDNLGGKGLSWVYGFSPEEWSFYFSKNGSLNVSGGSMNFDGNYLGISFNFENFLEGEGGLDAYTYDEVPGYGEMGCN